MRWKKPKIIRDKLKDKTIRDTWTPFETGEEKKRKKISIMKEQLRIEYLEISGHFRNIKKIIMSLKE